MARVHRHRARRTEVNIAKPEDQIAGVENRLPHRFPARQTIDTLDKIDVIRQPRRTGTYGIGIAADGIKRGAVFKGHRQVHNARWHRHLADVANARFQLQQQRYQRLLTNLAAVVAHLQRAHAG